VTRVCGPAGSGKTSLLATWAATRGEEVIAGLERHDDDPHQLWTSVLRSLQSTGAFEADAHMHDLAAPPGTVTPSFIDAVLAEISTLARPVCLVLDDVHVLRQTAALETIGLLIRRLPPALRVVLVSRTEPPLGLARLRVHGDVRDVRAADLGFTLEETAAYLAAQGVGRRPARHAGTAAPSYGGLDRGGTHRLHRVGGRPRPPVADRTPELAQGALGERRVQNTPSGEIRAPLLLGQGEADPLVLPDVQAAYVQARCEAGQLVDYRTYPGRDHVGVVAADSPLISELLGTRDRLDGVPPEDSYPDG
jgi:hypothetical protein